MKGKVLILTDHKNHSVENSLYDLSLKMLQNENTAHVDIATRENNENQGFFNCLAHSELWATRITENFSFKKEKHPLAKKTHLVDVNTYDLVWLRMPPPLSEKFLNFVDLTFTGSIIINNPKSIFETGSKAFLINFPSICPPMKICRSIHDIENFRKEFPIVLKPFNEYGGRGIVRIEADLVSSNEGDDSFLKFAQAYQENPIDYLAVKFLKNVRQGDKRIIVVNGQILGASLRLPKENSWLCNVAMGGNSNMAEVEPEEEKIVNTIDPILSKKGIVMYGVDTLVGDDGKRVLSEINTTSIGGLPQIAAMRNKPLVEKAIELIWEYYNENRNKNDE